MVGSASILLADDDPMVRRFLSRVLESAGYRVTEAGDGAEAILALGQAAHDLLIIDLSMPGKDGWEAIEEVRELWPDLKIIAISGFFTHEYLTMTKYLGADAALHKPIPPDRLLECVRGLLEGAHQRATSVY